MRKILLLLLASISISNIWAENEFTQTKPSVNAEMFKLPAQAQNSLNEGQLSVSIPLPSLKGKGYDLPISLTFYAGNITHLSDASPVGLGWSLNAGGSICISVNDTPDKRIKVQADAPWQFDKNYIENKYRQSVFDPTFADAINKDKSPDSYSYSLPGHSGEIIEYIGSTESARRVELRPDIEYVYSEYSNDQGYSITDDQGNEFIFGDKEITSKSSSSNDYTTAWFLSEIKTVQGGSIKFEYDSEVYNDYMSAQLSSTGRQYGIKRTKRIKKITSEYGYIVFEAEERRDRNIESSISTQKSKRISKISYYASSNGKSEFIQSYQLEHDYIGLSIALESNSPEKWLEGQSQKWLVLKRIKVLGKDKKPSMPSYEFEYKHHFEHSKVNISSNSWSVEDYNIFCVPNLKLNGTPAVYKQSPTGGQVGDNWVMGGCSYAGYEYDGTYGEYFVMTSATTPTQKEEQYLYEEHSFNKINNKVFIQGKCSGKRLKYKVTDGKDTIEYKYYDGSIDNIPINTTVSYKFAPVSGYPDHTVTQMYVATKHQNQNKTPHNSFMGQPVHYGRVQEIFKEKTKVKKILEYYYSPSTVVYPVNYIFTLRNRSRYRLQTINNGIGYANTDFGWPTEYFGNQIQALFLYPLAPFESGPNPYLKQVICYDENKKVVKRTINEYDNNLRFQSQSMNRYSYIVINNGKDSNGYEDYLISQSCHTPHEWIQKSATSIEYLYDGNQKDSIVEKVEYLNRTQNRVKEARTTRLGQSSVTKTVYIDDIISKDNARTKNVSSVLNQMWTKNLLGLPIQTSVSRNGVTQSANFNVYGVSSYNTSTNQYFPNWQYIVRQDSVLSFEVNGAKVVANPSWVNEKITHDPNFKWISYNWYAKDSDFVPERMRQRGTPPTLIEWDDNKRLPLALVENYPGQYLDATLKSLIKELQKYTVVSYANLQNIKSAHLQIMNKLPYTYTPVSCTTYTYNMSGQLTSTASSTGEMFFYFYDHAGRLSKVLDKDFNPVESYKYNYKEY